ncbi:MAG: 5-(carboxyamino)imidazole ribonucleotide synthase [Pseudomonadota bacterium]
MTSQLPEGATIGILGGGQLGRMLAMAAARLGYRTHIFAPAPAPAADVAAVWTQGSYDDATALASFAAACDVVTLEFENIPVAALDTIAAKTPVFPGAHALATSQDRLHEKRFLADLGLATAPFSPVDGPEMVAPALAETGLPAILKTRRFGYDGRGQIRVADQAEAETALASFAGAPLIAEGVVPFTTEISVIAARGQDGGVAAYDPGENRHEDGILATTTVPAHLPRNAVTDAVLAASRILTALNYVGVMGVEMFVTQAGLVINEMAPRVHNSGHWTQVGCAVDQFEQHIRAIAGWPLGDGRRHADVVMENLLGTAIETAASRAAETGTQLHLYGKGEARPGRKMGHINRITGPAS